MARDVYRHYVNDEGVEFNINTDKNEVDHINIYDSCPAENKDHGSIHINFDSDAGTGNIVDTTDGDKESTDVSCYLTTACMRHMTSEFDDNYVIKTCVDAIKKGDYDFAYNRYKSSILTLEGEFARPTLQEKFVKVLKRIR